MVSRDSGMRWLLRRLEAHARVADGDLVAVGQPSFLHTRAVDAGAVRGPEVDDDELARVPTDLGMTAADVRVRHHHIALGEPADRDGVVTDRDPPAVVERERPDQF